MIGINVKTIALFCMAGIALSGCNPFMDKILGPKINIDEEDFGGEAVDRVFYVGRTAEWEDIGTGAVDIIQGAPNGNYIINVTGDFSTTQNLAITGSTDLKVSIRGNHAITYSGIIDILLTVNSNQIYILRSPLKGNPNNANVLVENNFGELIMREGASISGNGSGGVNVGGNTFTMYGGTISGNSNALTGGGVYVSNGTFNMYGGKISGNIAETGTGGGVYVAAGETFIKTGGIIYGNDVGRNSNFASDGGHAACYAGSTFLDHTLRPQVTGNVYWPP
jgi:hypothetical protein